MIRCISGKETLAVSDPYVHPFKQM